MNYEVARSSAVCGDLMINEIAIKHFRCFDNLNIKGCKRINVLVGDNGSGKTAILEAIFLGLGSSSDLANRYRQIRGIEGLSRGTPRKLGDSFYADLFHNLDDTKDINIALLGSGPEARKLRIAREGAKFDFSGFRNAGHTSLFGVVFIWTDADGREFFALPTINNGQPYFPSTGEELPAFFYFAAGGAISSVENAERFSILSRSETQGDLIKLFSDEYKWIKNLSIEVIAGGVGVYARVSGVGEKIHIANISGGINRFLSVILGIKSAKNSIVIVDELDNGLYYKHQRKYWEYLISSVRESEGQIFISTHSLEWIQALVTAAGDQNDDIALWRIEKQDRGQPTVLTFSGDEIKDGIEYGADVRGDESL